MNAILEEIYSPNYTTDTDLANYLSQKLSNASSDESKIIRFTQTPSISTCIIAWANGSTMFIENT